MKNHSLNPEALEASAKALYDESPWPKSSHSTEGYQWDELTDDIRQTFRDETQTAVSASLAALTEPDSTLITDELTRVVEALHGYDCPDDPDPGEACTCDCDTYYRMAEVALEAAALPAPRTIETVEELEALPVESVIRTDKGWVYERRGLGWMVPGLSDIADLSTNMLFPATVLWLPTEGSGE